MCGIAGYWDPRGSIDGREERLRLMTRAIAHRGPDADGHWIAEANGVGLGHRRLSILDLSDAGAQPMHSATGRYVIVFNGELYNWQDLRREEEGFGARWRGHSDTEILLAMIERQGLSTAIRRCAGMFAFALWDRQERRLSLVRDRLGEKPLYYGRPGGTLLFASELKALRAHPSWRGAVDDAAVAEFLQVGYVSAPRSIYRDVEKVAPGTIVTFASDGESRPQVEVYWSARDVAVAGLRDPLRLGDDAALEMLDAALRRTVGEEMVADVPVGAFLSGGIDSSLVVAYMRGASKVPVRTFTVSFAERAYDEGDYAAAVAKALGTEHRSITLDTDTALGLIPELPRLYDEPFADPSAIPTTLVSRLARQHVTVALSGDGGDEVFGGYWRHFFGPRLWDRIRPVPRGARAGAAGLLAAPSPAAWDRLHAWASAVVPKLRKLHAPGDRIHKLAAVLATRSPAELYDRLLGYTSSGTSPRLPPLEGASFAEQMMLADLLGYLPDDILVKVDRAGMSVSLEGRAPFLDHRIVELAWRLPLRQRIRAGEGKWPLRQLLRRQLPAELFERPKMGFAVPLDGWLRGPLREWAGSLLAPATLHAAGGIDVETVGSWWQAHLSGRSNRSRQLWPVLMYVGWRHATPQ